MNFEKPKRKHNINKYLCRKNYVSYIYTFKHHLPRKRKFKWRSWKMFCLVLFVLKKMNRKFYYIYIRKLKHFQYCSGNDYTKSNKCHKSIVKFTMFGVISTKISKLSQFFLLNSKNFYWNFSQCPIVSLRQSEREKLIKLYISSK